MTELLLAIVGVVPSALVYFRLFYRVEGDLKTNGTRDHGNLVLRRRMGITGAVLGFAGMVLLQVGGYFSGGILIVFGYQFALWAIGVRLAILSNNVPDQKRKAS